MSVKRNQDNKWSRLGKAIERRKVRGYSSANKGNISKPITGWRLWLFRVIAIVVIPTILFLLLEMSLHIVGYGFPVTATVKCELKGTDCYCDNVKFGWRFFPRNIAREFVPFIFPADKPENTYRIFVFGASAAQGIPDGAFCFGRILQVMLQQEYPGVNFELINTAMTAINSHIVLEIAKDCARHDADLFVVYLGNNEIVGPYGAGTVFAPLSSNLSFIRFGIALRATSLGQLLTNLFESAGAEKNVPKVWGGIEMFLEKQIRADAPALETVYRYFEQNLKDISHAARKNGARIIFCTVGTNLKDSPPFASLHRPNLTEAEEEKWNEIYQQAVAYETAGKYAEAVQRHLAAAEIDDCYADLQFRLGQCYWAMAEYEKARDRYIKARQLDTLRIRAEMQINKIIRDVAGDRDDEGVYLVDAVKVLEENSPHNIPGEELFYEYAHLNFKGNYSLAKTIFERVEKILPERIKRQKANKRPLLTESECARRLAYTDWDRYKIADYILNGFIKKAPFTNQLYHTEQVRQMEQKLEALRVYLAQEALEKSAIQYRQAIDETPMDWWLHWKYAQLLLEDLKDDRAAAEQYRLVLQFLPHFYMGHVKLGMILGNRGDFDKAIAHDLQAIRLKPTCADAHYNLGLVYHWQNQFDSAVKYYAKALQLQPNHAYAYDNLGVLLYQQGRVDEAVEVYRKGLLRLPTSASLHYNLGILLNMQGQRDEAVKELRTALQIDPNYIEAREALKGILEKYN